MALREQMNESNLELVNFLTQQMGVSLNHVVDQLSRLIDSFRVQPTQTCHMLLRFFEELEWATMSVLRPRRVEAPT